MSSESRISQVYDIYGEEITCVERVYDIISNIADNHGFFKIQTAPFEEKERYLNATKVHFSKIFEVIRPKQRSTFLLKSDLAMSMSRFVADLSDAASGAYKFIQMDDLYRDRIPNLPGYRKNFKQILLGIWGTTSSYADAELISMCVEMLLQIQCFSDVYLQISNQNLLNVLGEDIASKVRFGDISIIESLLEDYNDYIILKRLYSKPNISFDELEKLSKEVSDSRIVNEMKKSLDLYEILQKVFQLKVPICFSLSNLGGTNHYSGMNYRVYASKGSCEYLLIDGGRIDSLTGCFNDSLNIPGVCMGIGVQVMAQLMKGNSTKKKQVYLVLNDSDDFDKLHTMMDLMCKLNTSSLNEKYQFCILPCKKFNIKAFFSSEFYRTCVIMFLNKKGINVRSNEVADEQIIKEVLKIL